MRFALVLGVFAYAGAEKIPAQFMYDAAAAASRQTINGCTITHWDGVDSDGMTGPPWLTYVSCSKEGSWKSSGVAVHGDFQIWKHLGDLRVDDQRLRHMGDSVWVAAGARVSVEFGAGGAAYIVGARFALDPEADPAVFTSSYLAGAAPRARSYALEDAVRGSGNASLGHDPHICNGSSPSMDFVFGSRTLVDPPSVVVLNCANGSAPQNNFVWSHFHPFGAVYMPFSGNVCFATDRTICATPGIARWTSANLQYYEFFQKINRTNEAADTVRDMAGVAADKCEFPVVFAVTNFDGAAGVQGVPNFDDWPVAAHGNNLALGIGPWGVFKRMTVRATKAVVKTSIVDAGGDVSGALV